MTIEETREIISKVTFYWELGEQTLTQNQINEALDMVFKALDKIEKIQAIIDIDNSVIREDVMKYKMICEVIANERKTES